MSESILIGYYHLNEDKIMHDNSYETAAWYRNILVKAGYYPVHASRITKTSRGEMVDGFVYIDFEGEIVSDYFGGLYFGVPIGSYDETKNKGKYAKYSAMSYDFDISKSILYDANSPYRLLPEYEARETKFTYNGETLTGHRIFKKEISIG